jgi:hypothetical protein
MCPVSLYCFSPLLCLCTSLLTTATRQKPNYS